MELNLNQTPDGIELLVKAAPGSRKNEVRGISDGVLKVAVTAIAEKGKANKAIIKLLAKTLGISKSQIELKSGMSSSSKKLLVSRIEISILEHQLRQLLNQ